MTQREPGPGAPGGKVPGGKVPGGKVPGGKVPGGKVPGGKVPGGTGPVEHLEAEVTLDVPEDWAVPDLAAALAPAGVAAVGEPVEHSLDARYLDTPDLRLLRARTTLRRRTGGPDAGWHLKLPRADGDRTEVHLGLQGRSLAAPAELASLVRATTRGAALGTVARLRTTRVVRPLLGAPGPDGVRPVLAEVADDAVTAEAPGRRPGEPAEVTTWRELEVELVEGERAVLQAAVRALVDAGARRSPAPSKLRRVLQDRLPAPTPAPPPPRPKGPAADLLSAHLRDLVAQLLDADPAVRRAAPDAVHQARVTTRRLRSALATFRPLLVAEVTDPLREELGWLARALGAARDAEVARDHLQRVLRAQDPDLVPAGVRDRLVRRLGADVDAALVVARAALDDDRYLRLLDALDALVAEPPVVPTAAARARDVLPGRVAREHRRLAGAVGAADGAPDPASRDDALHEARKSAKRARYAAQAVAPVVGEDAEGYAAAVAGVQEALGEVQDSVLTRRVLLGARAGADAGDLFALGRLHALEEARAERGEAAFERAWRAATRKRVLRWLR